MNEHNKWIVKQAQDVAVKHVCTPGEVIEFLQLNFTGLYDYAVLANLSEVYGGLRDLGLDHWRIVKHWNLIQGTIQVMKLIDKPDPWEKLPDMRLIRMD